ncbi:hypothetical protein FQZ97_900740 [compost metagenome]
MVGAGRWGGEPGQGGQGFPVFAAHLRAPAGGREHAVGEAGERAQPVGRTHRVVGQVEEKAHVERAARDLRQHVAAHALAQLGAHLRTGLDELLQEGAKAGELGVEDGADAQRAAHGGVQGGGGLAEVGQGGERALGHG